MAEHWAWCAGDHEDDDLCVSVSTEFPALDLTAWMGETSTGPRVVVSRPIEGEPAAVAAFAAWLQGFAGQAATAPTEVPR